MQSHRFRKVFIPLSYAAVAYCSIEFPTNLAYTVPRELALAAGATLFALTIVGAARIHSMFPKRRHDRPEDFDKLLTTGPYALCRHPFYLMLILNQLSIPVMFASIAGVATWAALLAGWLYLIRIEESELVAYWGDEYLRYAERVPMLIPIPRRRKKS
ncbi:MAG: isoprenylcysteine carboxylmethyltransferase family protein [Crenarchaeota archaeon]|nr:isoprenylcysteine carboxylmethyltransferase family protein [Thermoproteota archaeon]